MSYSEPVNSEIFSLQMITEHKGGAFIKTSNHGFCFKQRHQAVYTSITTSYIGSTWGVCSVNHPLLAGLQVLNIFVSTAISDIHVDVSSILLFVRFRTLSSQIHETAKINLAKNM